MRINAKGYCIAEPVGFKRSDVRPGMKFQNIVSKRIGVATDRLRRVDDYLQVETISKKKKGPRKVRCGWFIENVRLHRPKKRKR